MVSWTKKEEIRAKRYLVSEQTLDWEIYDLFGFGALTSEIVEYLIGLLKKSRARLGGAVQAVGEILSGLVRWHVSLMPPQRLCPNAKPANCKTIRFLLDSGK